ncbi:MAG: ATP-dependent RecD-like DNA helicase [Oscillospiraceae bacterium]|nr:ATP-dependent RecD-like DNA helicase [Oscillospiraceae bacterium]
MEGTIIEGVVSSIVFANHENGYTVLRLETQAGLSTAAGCLPGVSVGERLVISGSWTNHPQYGEQFKADSFKTKLPDNADDIFRYLASGAIKNIGPAKARDIVERFGANSLSVIENEPEKLSVIRGISVKSALQIGEGYRRQAGLRRLIDFFSQYGTKPLVATRIYRDFGDVSVDIVRENPYIIASEIYGAEFSEADSIAIDLGFDSDCPERVSAAAIYELTHNLNNGHTFIPRMKLVEATAKLIGVGHDPIADALEALCECGDVVIEDIAGEDGCYLRYVYDAEQYSAERLLSMVRSAERPDGLQALIGRIEREHGIKYAALQHKALELAAESCVMALTGGPGTGKTTTIRGILMLFDELGYKTALCAPTGRAAKRLSEMCGREAATIHRLLGTSPGESDVLMFDHDENNPLRVDVVIVDESSMIDVLLMRSLLAAIHYGGRLIMVGDADQLPPVGPGNAFADIIGSGIVPTIALTEIFRQDEDSGIILCAHDVNKGIVPDISKKYPDLFFLKRQTEEQIAETVAELISQRLPKSMGFDPSQIQVLSPTRRRAAGTEAMNDRLREAVNPRSAQKKEKQSGDFLFRVGDKVMQIRNNYDIVWTGADGFSDGRGVYNGDIGVITGINNDTETICVDYEDKFVTYLFEQLPELEPAFAMTVHKSQGSEYGAVILAIAAGAPRLLTRSILYTAMTRAKKLLVIVGNPDVMAKMVYNNVQMKRYSGLKARLRAQ